MMYIVRKGSDRSDTEWHVGDPILNNSVDFVTEVQADGDELEYVLNRFEGLPRVKNKRVVRWHSDVARFIVANLV